MGPHGAPRTAWKHPVARGARLGGWPRAGWLLAGGVLLLALALGAAASLGRGGGSGCAAELEPLRARMPDVVGECAGPARADSPSGDLVQATTQGTLRLRRSDRAALFAAGDRVWVEGPFGLQERRADERFAWEAPR